MTLATPQSGAQRRVRPVRAGSRSKGTTLPLNRADVTLRDFVEPNRWQRMDWLRDHSARRGQRLCGLSALVDEVTVQRGKNGVHFGGLLTCGSRTCPNCGPKIAASTRSDVELAIRSWMGTPGRKLLFGTFTIRHKRGQGFAELAAAVSSAWAAATGGRGWIKDREAHGIAHTLRIFEQKWSQANGWHIHVHALFFVDDRLLDGDGDHSGLLGTMFQRWAAKAVALGMGTPLIRAQDLHEVVDIADALAQIARYTTKETTDVSDRHPGSIAAEMTNSAGKQGLTSLTPGQLLAWAIDGEPYIAQLWGRARPGARGRGVSGQEYAQLLYREFELGMKGRRSIAWSQGMREALGIGAELTDAELAERQEALDTATAETLVSMDGSAWRKFTARPGRRAALYALAATYTPGELVQWLSGFGVHAIPRRRDRELDSPSGPWFTDLPTPF